MRPELKLGGVKSLAMGQNEIARFRPESIVPIFGRAFLGAHFVRGSTQFLTQSHSAGHDQPEDRAGADGAPHRGTKALGAEEARGAARPKAARLFEGVFV